MLVEVVGTVLGDTALVNCALPRVLFSSVLSVRLKLTDYTFVLVSSPVSGIIGYSSAPG